MSDNGIRHSVMLYASTTPLWQVIRSAEDLNASNAITEASAVVDPVLFRRFFALPIASESPVRCLAPIRETCALHPLFPAGVWEIWTVPGRSVPGQNLVKNNLFGLSSDGQLYTHWRLLMIRSVTKVRAIRMRLADLLEGYNKVVHL
ncbi:uncharacterized protein BO88DRAFT_170867 [Aspergillus vadensis CBS 113365]|uniref:Uncharacterized protein n=1 Tax=Aspergillus vadensis (strain CBS 113365 / IMI 142717 / IBT 24658) TaxID=1448311 RepID=A0A319CXN9_ASPVC|nr:hypothetical protein BO88DRAFT_170867 [Aspergillus vadensis CBS 113365]PYH72842.1 hypothetical protein BO88DRAFT_170867 [Aspergillus vadensis CBS 113365]